MLVGLFAGLAIFFMVWAIVQWSRRQAPMPLPEFLDRLDSWRSTHPNAGIVTGHMLTDSPPDWHEPDIFDYGAEGLLVTTSSEIVDFLVLNEVHADARLVILATNGYPDYVLPKAKELLQRRPDLPVYLLHAQETSTTVMEHDVARLLDRDHIEAISLGFTSGSTGFPVAEPLRLDHLEPGRLLHSIQQAREQNQRIDVLLATSSNSTYDGASFG